MLPPIFKAIEKIDVIKLCLMHVENYYFNSELRYAFKIERPDLESAAQLFQKEFAGFLRISDHFPTYQLSLLDFRCSRGQVAPLLPPMLI